jgi:GDP-4-dehydro-6-deoxy-D-mannose reductase
MLVKHLLLTGSNGFVGKVLLRKLIKAGYSVTCATTTPNPYSNNDAKQIKLDVRDAAACVAALKHYKPTHIVHLAAISHVPTSFQDPLLTWNTNVLGFLNLLEAVKQQAPDAFVVFSSSSEVYGEAFKSGIALNEDSSCLPMNPYAASKLAAELVFQQYFKQGISGVIARPFNHIGVGQSSNFATASFAKQIALIEMGRQPPVIQVGNLNAYRDFLDVRDVCTAYVQLLDLRGVKSHPRVFNIASNKACKIDDVLQKLINLTNTSINVELDPQRLRSSDIPFAVGDCDRIQTFLDWKPKIPLTESLASLLTDWRRRVVEEQ